MVNQQLLTKLKDLFTKYNIHKSWWGHLEPLFKAKEMSQVQYFLPTVKYEPSKEHIFDFFQIDPKSILVVLIGELEDFIDQIEIQKYSIDFNPDRLFRNNKDYWKNQGIVLFPRYLTWDSKSKHVKQWQFLIDYFLNLFKEWGIPMYEGYINCKEIETNIYSLNNLTIQL